MQTSLRQQILPGLSLILLVLNQVPELQGQEFRFGPCQVTGVVLPELWEAFWTVKNTVVSAYPEPFHAASLLEGRYFFRIVDPFSACLINFVHKNPLSSGGSINPMLLMRKLRPCHPWTASSKGSRAPREERSPGVAWLHPG